MMIRYGQWMGAALLLGVSLAGVVACGDSAPSDGAVTAEGAAQGGGEDVAGRERRRAGRAEGAITLGDLNKPKSAAEVGAPFDPCALGWAAFPVEVRPVDGKPHAPTARQPKPEDPYSVSCVYDNSGKVSFGVDGGAVAATAGTYFVVSVVWGERLNADPAKREGAQPKSWNGRNGLVHRQPDDPQRGAGCVTLVALGKGVAGVSVTNSRFPGVDPCVVGDAVITAITTTTR